MPLQIVVREEVLQGGVPFPVAEKQHEAGALFRRSKQLSADSLVSILAANGEAGLRVALDFEP